MDAITLLKDDHKTVEQLFKRFEKAGDRAHVEKRRIVDRIIEELSRHAAIEEQIFYPVARATVPDTEDTALESIEEHHIVKWVLSELEGMDPEDERFDAKVTVLIENVRHHVEEEEGELFPKVRAELGRNALADLGDSLEKAKSMAPTHPHPRSPDSPPGNVVAGAIAGVTDKVGDTVTGIARGSVAAVQDLIARILNTKKPSAPAKGSSTARKRATGTRKAASTVVDGASSTAASARSGAKRTARTATSGAKRTARTAKAGAKRTSRTATSGAKRTARTASSTAKKAGTAARTGR
jgi:hemerythrin superfamily protein